MDTERQLRSELDQMTKRGDSDDNEWKTRYEGLNKAHQELQGDLRQQQMTAREVKQEAAGFLSEMKMLSERTSQAAEKEENLIRQNHKLEEEVRQWKSRYARAKTQLRTLRTSSFPLQQADLKQIAKAGDLTRDDGLVKDFHVINFQIAIDDLLQVARLGEPESVLSQVKSVVIAVREISQDVRDTGENDSQQQTSQLKAKVSATTNNLITASRNFAVSNGLSPISLLDAAASHLTAAIVELIRITKICPTFTNEADGDGEDNSIIAESPAGYYGLQHERMSTGGDSIYSSMSSPKQQQPPYFQAHRKNTDPSKKPLSREGLTNGSVIATQLKPGSGIREQDSEIEELKVSRPEPRSGLTQLMFAGFPGRPNRGFGAFDPITRRQH